MRDKRPYEEGFLIILLLLAVFGLLWLFQPFLEALFFAMILSTASYRYYLRLLPKCRYSPTKAASIMSFAVFAGVIAPVTYLLVEVSLQFGEIYAQAQNWLNQQDAASLQQLNKDILDYLPLSEEAQAGLLAQLKNHSASFLSFAQKAAVFLLEGLVGTTSSFVTFIGLSVFALFFFYRDGHAISNHLKILSPLENRYDQMIMDRFSNLSTVLTLSVIGIAAIQGISFALFAWLVGLPGLFIGMAVAVTSFIPIVGAALVWVPVVIYTALQGDYWVAGATALWGIVVTGFVIDNIVRPILINRLTRTLGAAGEGLAVANHTLLTVLSTFAGLMHFGVIGLFFGPVIAAMAITVLDVYEHKNSDLLDRS
ncbi:MULTISPECIES: AI-2E family transporter [Thiomicrorhabdus]|uniref:AI-2E family transporter n=1 Tax=Thiomicrorhabdus heinhorstiae TaxID=2748010 RepID=A0ABS0BUY2_9GAMM|nr:MULTISPECIES: AI-2E family transporter [Thiomicrorhabdus]MBF6057645.1 AI-2E family transporter [Thiomicrorhabdus heinhorstiae]